MSQHPGIKKSRNPYERRISCLLLFLFSIIGTTVFFLGVNPQIFGYEFENYAISRLIAWTLVLAIIGIGIFWLDLFQFGQELRNKLSWWRVLIYGWTLGIIPGILISALPYFSLTLYLISIICSLLLTLSIFLARRNYSFFLRLVHISYFPNIFFLLAMRIWIDLIGFHWGWFIVFLGSYIFSWSIPILLPKLSKFLYREQSYPRTTIGKILYRLIFLLLPSGTSGALLGMYVNRYLGNRVSLLVIALLSSIFSIVIAQPLSHILFTEGASNDMSV